MLFSAGVESGSCLQEDEDEVDQNRSIIQERDASCVSSVSTSTACTSATSGSASPSGATQPSPFISPLPVRRGTKRKAGCN
jgi:hypothetical protein